jgi:hypothetical protein
LSITGHGDPASGHTHADSRKKPEIDWAVKTHCPYEREPPGTAGVLAGKNLAFISSTRKRVYTFLYRCRSEELQSQAQAIREMLVQFEQRYAIRLLPQDPSIVGQPDAMQ